MQMQRSDLHLKLKVHVQELSTMEHPLVSLIIQISMDAEKSAKVP